MSVLLRKFTGRWTGYAALIVLALVTYLYGLDGFHIPRNGDEDVYAHIVRLTAQSGELLPLQSELNQMRNTKPPLLFWQGIASTHWGEQWDWWHLRYPSVIYTMLTALLLFMLGRKLTGNGESGMVAALLFLAFFSTYRFGRPFLVNPAEVFWFFLPFFTLLYWRASSFASRLWLPLLLGVEIGIGLLYKSFALLAPIGMVLTWWYWQQREYRWKPFLLNDLVKLIIVAVVALGMFGLWFLLDPDPAAVWQEFVVGENAGKMGAHGSSYWKQLMWGGSSFWALLLGYPMNAGLFAFPVAALFIVSFRQRRHLSDTEKMLWIWMAVLLLVFSIPSQRSARYLLEAMPAVALLVALNWRRLPRWTFVVVHVCATLMLALMGYLAWHLQRAQAEFYGVGFAVLVLAGGVTALLAVWRSAWTRQLSLLSALLTLLALSALLKPFDGPLGNFDAAALRQVQGKTVWIPCNFRAVDEGYRFLLPGAQVLGYAEDRNLTPADLAVRFPVFISRQSLQDTEICPGCRVIGQRLELRQRQSPEEINAMLRGQVFEYLFDREWLIESTGVMPAQQASKAEAACR